MAPTVTADAIRAADDEIATVARLKSHEQELSRRLEEARRAADARIFEAREAAAHVEALEEADCREEIARLRDERARQLGALLEAVQQETMGQTATVARRAAEHREAVLATLLAAVTGDAP